MSMQKRKFTKEQKLEILEEATSQEEASGVASQRAVAQLG